MPGKLRGILGLLAAIAVPIVGGLLSSIPTFRSIPSWYQTIKKPSWTPPQWAFGPVWTVLYVLMGVASWLVSRKAGEDRRARLALAFYGIQLLLNWIWTPIFFGLRAPGWALAEISVMWQMVIWTISRFSQVRPVAGLLLVPYFLWVTVATALNASVWWLNRSQSRQP